jgi:hypothetical protein
VEKVFVDINLSSKLKLIWWRKHKTLFKRANYCGSRSHTHAHIHKKLSGNFEVVITAAEAKSSSENRIEEEKQTL